MSHHVINAPDSLLEKIWDVAIQCGAQIISDQRPKQVRVSLVLLCGIVPYTFFRT